MAELSIIPLQAVPNQTVVVAIGNQRCRFDVFEKQRYPLGETPSPALYLNVWVNDVPIVAGVLMRTGVALLRDPYLAFIGELMLLDVSGNAEPVAAGLGTRWVLGYLA